MEAISESFVPFYKFFDPSLFPDKDAISKLSAIEEIYFIGYPAGLFDERHNLPITRRGISASPPSIDYNGLPQMLVDASIFYGSSGSPVLIFNQGAYVFDRGITLGNRLFLLGLLSNAFTLERKHEIGVGTKRATLKMKDAIDLGVVWKARTIEEAIRACLDASHRRNGHGQR